MLTWLGLLAALAVAAPTREVEREQPSPPDTKGARFTDGFFSMGSYIGNQGNASARPDGSGAAITRSQLFFRDRASSDQLRFIAHGVFLTDRRKAFAKPVSVDYYLSAARMGPTGGWMQVGRGEALSFDRTGASTRFWDFRLGSERHADGGAAGYFVGWYFKNEGRTPRPDLSGETFLRYSLFFDTKLAGPLRARMDADFLTDKKRRRYRPAAVDLKLSVGVFINGNEITASWEPWVSFDGEVPTNEAWVLAYTYRFDTRSGPN